MIAFKEAAKLLPYLPTQEGESVHCLMNGRYDLALLLAAILDNYVKPCHSFRIATLAFNSRNLSELAHMLDKGIVASVTLLCSDFFRQHNNALYAEAQREACQFPGRWRIAAARCHAKVYLADFGEWKLAMESSANLRTNSNAEQLTIIRDGKLHDWHAAWIDQMVSRHG
jgi:hypothetical protein